MMRKKVFSIFVIFTSLFLLLSLSLARWQIVEGAKWADMAAAARKFTKTIQSQRGIIKDSNGKILASNEVVYDIYVYKKEVKNVKDFVPKLAELVNTPKESYEGPMNDDNIQYFEIAKKASQDIKDSAITLDCEMNIPKEKRAYDCNDLTVASAHTTGINIIQTSKRVYPNGSLASHVLGFMGLNENGDEVGSNGVEGYYDQYLIGKTGIIEGTRDQSGNFILRDDLKATTGEDGTYLQLTLDIGIQKIVEEKLKAQVEAQNAKGGTVVVMDPSTGDILAMANYPTFDSSKYYEGEIIDCTQPRYKSYKTCMNKLPVDQQDPDWVKMDQNQKDAILEQEKNIPGIFTNQGLSEVREPGSIVKVATVAAAINEGKVTATTKVPDHAGCIMVADRKICTSNFVGAKDQTVEKMIEISDNIGALYVGKTLGADTLYKYFDQFGIGREVRVGLDGESIFPMKDPSDWNEVDLATASFGQGIVSTNSLENLSLIATVANKGQRVQPHIIKRFVSGDKSKDFVPQVVARPVSESTAKQVVDILEQSTREGYTAPPLRDVLKNYTMGGKTGTAQIPDGKGGYIVGAYNNTYIGFAPAYNPKFIMLVTIREPEHGTYAGFSAVPVWRDIAIDLLPYLNVPPDKTNGKKN